MRAWTFQSCLAVAMQNFVSLRQLSGTDYHSQARMLWYFDGFLSEQECKELRITRQITDSYVETLSNLAPRTRQNRFCVVRQLCQYLSRIDPLAYVPEPLRLIPSQKARPPYIYTDAEIRSLLAAASQLPPANSLRPHTYRTLLGLLASTGLRIAEAFAVTLADFYSADQRLYIAQGKFRKARWVPLTASTCRALDQYLGRRLRLKPHSPDSPLFLNQRSRRLHYPTVHHTFRKLLSQCVIPLGEQGGPRIHDLRHTFAVHRLLAWYRDGEDVNARLPWLATYMGHVDLHSTQVYLQATPELTEHVAQRFHDYYRQRIEYEGDLR